MFTLLEKDYQTLLKMIDLFYYDSPKQTITHLAERLDVHRKTIQRLINILLADAKKQKWPALFRLTKESTLISMEFSDNFSTDFLYNFYLGKSLGYLFLDAVFQNRFQNVLQFAEDSFVSMSSVQRKMPTIKNVLGQYGLQLNLKLAYPLIGTEHQIRYFQQIFYWHRYQENQWPFATISEKTLDRFIDKVIVFYPNATFADIQNLKLATAICLLRLRNKQKLDKDVDFSIQNFFVDYDQFHQLYEDIFAFYLSGMKVAENEYQFLYYLFTVMNNYAEEEFDDLNLQALKQGVLPCELTSRWIGDFCTHFDATISSRRLLYLYTNLYNIHSVSRLFQGEFVFSYEADSMAVFSRNNYQVVQKMTEFYQTLQKDSDFQVLLGRNSRLFYQYCLLARSILPAAHDAVKVLLLTKNSKIQASWLKNQISSLKFVPVEFVEGLGETPDLIVSDLVLDQQKYQVQEVQVFQWMSSPNVTDWQRLQKMLAKVYADKLGHA